MSWLKQRVQKLMFWRDEQTPAEFEITDCWPDLPEESATADSSDDGDHRGHNH